ncbi:hypothetical protein [Edwardsiella tarda]|uniref:hypothetical protein n=1 Tax=Edwardsiella tarda TaxID=636 RepID=UPI00099002DC|nr:hypothetical protein [Edwardsiella tarda]
MNSEEIQNDIDDLLVFMNDELESCGGRIKTTEFDFGDGESDRKTIDEKLKWSSERLFKIIKICNSRGLVDDQYGDFSHLQLTEEGQSRAISVKHGKNRSYELGVGTQIASLTINGPAQVGSGNIQNIQSVFSYLLQQIDDADASEDEKNEAKGSLKKFLSHPLVTAVVGGMAGGLPGLLG